MGTKRTQAFRPLDGIMKYIAILCLLVLSFGVVTPAIAAPHIIATLGTQSLLGKAKTAPALRHKMHEGAERLKVAASELGLTPAEYIQVEQQLESQPTWVLVPRHLDAMSWYAGGKVRSERDVIIPANTYGWEVQIDEGDHTLNVYMPASCGNLSIIRRFKPRVANANSFNGKPWGIAAHAEHAPVATAAPSPPMASAPAASAPPTSAVATTTSPAAAIPAMPSIPAAPTSGHFRFLPWLAAIGLAFWIGGGGGNHQVGGSLPPPVVCTNPCKCKP